MAGRHRVQVQPGSGWLGALALAATVLALWAALSDDPRPSGGPTADCGQVATGACWRPNAAWPPLTPSTGSRP
jgi:hypothetical protein